MALSFINSPVFDAGSIAQINEVLQQVGIKRPLICTDPGLVQIGLIESLRQSLSNEYGWEIFDQTPENPTQVAVEDAMARYKSGNCDGVISFGGGSSIDLGKAVTIMATHDGAISDYNAGGAKVVESKTAPMVAIPTTSGTGSEVSSGAVVIMRSGAKLLIVSPHIVPDAAICDPDLTLGLPPVLTAGAGMDAMTHCIEAVLSPIVNPPAEAVGLDGLERGIRNGHLLAAVQDGQDREARWNMMMASTEGAMAFTKGLGIVHAMSHACGSLPGMRLHHGTLNGVILPTILRFNLGHCDNKYGRLARSMGLAEDADLADYIQGLNGDIGLPANLSEMGVQSDHVEYLIDHAMKDPLHFIAPRIPSKEEYEGLFAQAMGVA